MDNVFLITEFGASPEAGALENGDAIQKAVDAAERMGGGMVVVPPGRFTTSSFILKSRVRLRVEKGGGLIGSSEWEDYPVRSRESVYRPTALIYAERSSDLGIEGEGFIDGQGQKGRFFPSPSDPLSRRPFLIFMTECRRVSLRGITLENPAYFTFMAEKSRGIAADGVTIRSSRTENGDGLDFDGSSHVTIRNCRFDTGDDAISPKTLYPGWPCEDFEISDCHFRSVWAAFRVGTETAETIRNILIRDCVFDGCGDGIKIQDCGPGILENITVRRVLMRDVHRPFFITVNPFRMSPFEESVRPRNGGIRDLLFEDVTAVQSADGREYRRNCMVLSGSMERRIENIVFRDCRFVFRGEIPDGAAGRSGVPEYLDYTTIFADIFSIPGGFPSSGLYARHADDLSLERCDWIGASADGRPVVFLSDTRRVRIADTRGESEGSALIQAADAEITLRNCRFNGREFTSPAPLNEAEQARYDAMKESSSRTLEQFKAFAEAVDRALALPERTGIALSDSLWAACDEGEEQSLSFELNLPGQTNGMLLLRTFGDLEVFLNGEKIGECVLDEAYRNTILWACDLSGHARRGTNRLTFRWKDPDFSGGMACELPFGAFRETKTGVFGAELRWGEVF